MIKKLFLHTMFLLLALVASQLPLPVVYDSEVIGIALTVFVYLLATMGSVILLIIPVTLVLGFIINLQYSDKSKYFIEKKAEEWGEIGGIVTVFLARVLVLAKLYVIVYFFPEFSLGMALILAIAGMFVDLISSGE